MNQKSVALEVLMTFPAIFGNIQITGILIVRNCGKQTPKAIIWFRLPPPKILDPPLQRRNVDEIQFLPK